MENPVRGLWVLRSLLNKVVRLDFPAGTEYRTDEGIGLGAIDGTIGVGIPKDFLPGTEGELTDEEARAHSVWWSGVRGRVVGGGW